MERIVTRHATRLVNSQSTWISRTFRKRLPQQHLRYRSNDSKNDNQVYPLTGYYADILSSRETPAPEPLQTPVKDQPQPSTTITPPPASPSSLEATKAQPLAKARIVFGSSGSSRREHKDQISAASKEIAGVKVPPKPKEPTGDDCCMSGCVNCVWDIYREEFEEWSAAAKSAREKMVAMQKEGDGDAADAAETASSVDDDGGGSEALWIQESEKEEEKDPYAGVPVGIREFMKMEKMMKEKQAAQQVSKG
jgi:predicted  nucleic acid-binding Zn-ribbon protein